MDIYKKHKVQVFFLGKNWVEMRKTFARLLETFA